MNNRLLYCKKPILAIGQENSISDIKNKLLICFECKDFIFCKGSQEYAKKLKTSLDNMEYLKKRYTKNKI